MPEFPIITKLGGRDAVYDHLSKALGIQTMDAMRMWRARGNISRAAMQELMRLAKERGIPCEADDFDLQDTALSNGEG